MTHSACARIAICAGAALLPVLVFSSLVAERWLDNHAHNFVKNRYIGAKGCKNCHKAEAKGAQFVKWEKDNHAKAWTVLGTDEAKKVGAKLGVDNPQESPKCLKCHVTAYGETKKEFKASFDPKLGVQCETCHGPGEKHAKARFKEASKQKGGADKHIDIPDDEIIKRPGFETCLKCHNEESPSFKPFCFKKKRAEIAHLDPRIKRTKEELEALECQCGDDCKCKTADCSKVADAGGKKKTEEKKTEEKKAGEKK